MNDSSIYFINTDVMRSIHSSIKKITAVITWKLSLNMELYRYSNFFFWKIRTIKVLMPGGNPAVFHANDLPLDKNIQLRACWKKSSSLLWGSEVSENRALNGNFFALPVYQGSDVR